MSIAPAPAREAAPPAPGIILALAALITPPLAVFAPLGLAPLLALVALALLATGGRRVLDGMHGHADLAGLFLLISAWAALSALWSPIPGHSLFESARFLAIAAAGLVVTAGAASLANGAAERSGLALVAGIAITVILLQVELRSGEAIAHLIGGIPEAKPLAITRYDRGITVLMLLAWPAAAALAVRRRWLALALLGAAVGVTVNEFDSHASMLAFAVAFVLGAIAWRLPRLVAACLVAGMLLPALAFPLVAPGGPGIESIHRTAPELPASAIHRLAIWRFAGDRIAERPLLGWGMDASRAIPGGKTPVYQLFPEIGINHSAEAMPLHPHNAALQWRLELGLPGTLLIVVLLGRVLWRLARQAMPHWRRALGFAYAGAACTVALLSFGAWQAWWLSALWLGAALLGRLGQARDSATA
jgi:exopolysaccharide production protein ExoQ